MTITVVLKGAGTERTSSTGTCPAFSLTLNVDLRNDTEVPN